MAFLIPYNNFKKRHQLLILIIEFLYDDTIQECELNIVCASTPAESRVKFWYQ